MSDEEAIGRAPSAVRPMEGDGAYNRQSAVQAAGLAPAVEWLAEASNAAAIAAGDEPVVIADYGASEGRNSVLPIGAAIARLRSRIGLTRPIGVVHTDLPDNDFTALFRTLSRDPASYLNADPAAYAYAIGRSYFQQILPTASVTLGWSSWAVQWLSRAPSIIPDHVQVAFNADASVRAAFHAQAATDWRAFLVARGRELKCGGRLVIVTMSVDRSGSFGYAPVVGAIHDALTALEFEGFLTSGERARMVIPTVGRSAAEFAAPFAGGPFQGLALERFESYLGDDDIWSGFKRTGDAREFGAEWARFSRASVFPSLAAGLDKPSAERRAQFLARLETGMAGRLAAAPTEVVIPLARMTIAKQG